MDEIAERKKLETLDLTEDVIEMILEKKRRVYSRKTKVTEEEIALKELPEIDVDQPNPVELMPNIPEIIPQPVIETRYRWSALKRRMVPY